MIGWFSFSFFQFENSKQMEPSVMHVYWKIPNNACILKDDTQRKLFVFQNLRFGYELYPFTESVRVTYVIELFSLPPPTDAEIDSGLYERYVLSLPPLHSKSLGYRRLVCWFGCLLVAWFIVFWLTSVYLSVASYWYRNWPRVVWMTCLVSSIFAWFLSH